MGEHFSLYVAPINLDPESPAMPISHPAYYATYLAKKVGAFATLGLAEDTWALNEGVTDDGTFLKQTYDIDRERESMFFAALDRLRQGALVCVFDATDRIQHMFWRDIDPGHPAGRGPRAGAAPRRHPRAVSAQRRAGRPRAGADEGRRRADGHLGPRLQLVPPRREPEPVAAARGLSGAEARHRRQHRVAARRRLVARRGPTRWG